MVMKSKTIYIAQIHEICKKRSKSIMPMKNENIYIGLAQVLLVDPASENPKIHSGRRSISKRQMIRRLELMVKDYQSLSINVDLEPYQETITYLKKLKSDREYEEVIQEFSDAYDPFYGVFIDPKEERIKEEVTQRNEVVDINQEETESPHYGRSNSNFF